jgi:hypothetical protein
MSGGPAVRPATAAEFAGALGAATSTTPDSAGTWHPATFSIAIGGTHQITVHAANAFDAGEFPTALSSAARKEKRTCRPGPWPKSALSSTAEDGATRDDNSSAVLWPKALPRPPAKRPHSP